MKKEMNKTEAIKQNSIDDTKNIKGAEKIEYIKQNSIQTPTYEYGNSQNTLDYNISLRNKPSASWWSFKLWTFTITATWNIAVTWLWFTPKYVEFRYVAATWLWIWNMTSVAQEWYDPKWLAFVSTDCVYIRDAWSVIIARTSYVSLDSDWFTINCTFFASSLAVRYTAFG